MKSTPLYTALALAFGLAVPLHSQNATQPVAQTSASQAPAPAKTNPFKPLATQAPGAGPDKVWVNANTKVYHCPADRYYGRTKNGQYMTEAAAKAAGDFAQGGVTCFK